MKTLSQLTSYQPLALALNESGQKFKAEILSFLIWMMEN